MDRQARAFPYRREEEPTQARPDGPAASRGGRPRKGRGGEGRGAATAKWRDLDRGEGGGGEPTETLGVRRARLVRFGG